MTACTNHGGKARRVVTAALVGVLSVGTVPMVALATGADDVSLMAVEPDDAFAGGTVAAQDGKGGEVTFPAKDLVSFSAGSGKYLLPTSITVEGDLIELNLKNGSGNATVKYYKGSFDDPTDAGTTGHERVCQVGKDITTDLARDYKWDTAGTYTAVIEFVKDGSTYKGAKKLVSFNIVNADLASAEIFNATDGNTDATQTDFVWNGGKQKVGLAVDGTVLDSDDYSLTIKQGDTTITDGMVEKAGSYTAYVYEHGKTSDTPKKVIDFTVEKLDLADADVTIGDVLQNTGIVNTFYVNGMEFKDLDGSNADTISNNPYTIVFNGGVSTTGERSAVVSIDADEIPTGWSAYGNVVSSSATVHFNVVEELFDSNYFYDTINFTSGGSLTIDLAKGEYFDESEISVGDDNGGKLDPKAFDVTYTDASGNVVDAAALSKAGTYKVNVRVNASRSDWTMGSATHTLDVTVLAPVVTVDDVVFRYNGEIAGTNTLTGSGALTYNGSDFLANITATVKCGNKTLAEGTDYELVVLDETGKAVESIVDAGKYKVIVKSDTYDVVDDEGANALNVEVKPIDLRYLYAKSDLMQNFQTGDFVHTIIPYTGEDLGAEFTFGYYTDAAGNVKPFDASQDYTWNELPEGTIEIDGIKYLAGYNADADADSVNDHFDWSLSDAKVVDTLSGKGFYRIYVDTADDVVNYTIDTLIGPAATDLVEVSDAKVFSDVTNDAWYAEPVYTAKYQGYINGYAGTTLFGPNNTITRGDVACVLFNMSGAPKVTVSEDKVDQDIAYATKFTDVDKNAYYARAIGWAAKLGIVNGYPDGTFQADKPVTREEFACMLANYAKALGEDVNAAEADLTSFADAGQISSWATESVEWAVSKKVMGNGGVISPSSSITRAEVAAMAVNYQPEALSNVTLL